MIFYFSLCLIHLDYNFPMIKMRCREKQVRIMLVIKWYYGQSDRFSITVRHVDKVKPLQKYIFFLLLSMDCFFMQSFAKLRFGKNCALFLCKYFHWWKWWLKWWTTTVMPFTMHHASYDGLHVIQTLLYSIKSHLFSVWCCRFFSLFSIISFSIELKIIEWVNKINNSNWMAYM